MTVVCNHCGADNLEGALVCESCGRLLTPKPEKSTTDQLILSKLEMADKAGPESPGTKTFSQQVRLVLDLDGQDNQVIEMQDKNEVVIGRSDKFSTPPTIDLRPLEGLEKGVSRRHAAIQRMGDRLYIVDRSSTNGTYLNGEQLVPNAPMLLHDGDTVHLGRFKIAVHFVEA